MIRVIVVLILLSFTSAIAQTDSCYEDKQLDTAVARQLKNIGIAQEQAKDKSVSFEVYHELYLLEAEVKEFNGRDEWGDNWNREDVLTRLDLVNRVTPTLESMGFGPFESPSQTTQNDIDAHSKMLSGILTDLNQQVKQHPPPIKYHVDATKAVEACNGPKQTPVLLADEGFVCINDTPSDTTIVDGEPKDL